MCFALQNASARLRRTDVPSMLLRTMQVSKILKRGRAFIGAHLRDIPSVGRILKRGTAFIGVHLMDIPSVWPSQILSVIPDPEQSG